TKSSKRQAAADRLCQADHVGLHCEELGGAAPTELCASLDFVEDQQRAILVAERAQTFEKSWFRHADADVHHDGFENNRCNLAWILLEAVLDTWQIVETGDGNVIQARLGDAEPGGDGIRRIKVTDLLCLRLDAHEGRIVE